MSPNDIILTYKLMTWFMSLALIIFIYWLLNKFWVNFFLLKWELVTGPIDIFTVLDNPITSSCFQKITYQVNAVGFVILYESGMIEGTFVC